jgi:hypothetical protein
VSGPSPQARAAIGGPEIFCNEGNGYYDYVAAMLRAVPPGQEVASWLICTRAFQRRYGLGIARPVPLPVRPYIRSGYLKTGRTIGERRWPAGSTSPGWSGRRLSTTCTLATAMTRLSAAAA